MDMEILQGIRGMVDLVLAMHIICTWRLSPDNRSVRYVSHLRKMSTWADGLSQGFLIICDILHQDMLRWEYLTRQRPHILVAYTSQETEVLFYCKRCIIWTMSCGSLGGQRQGILWNRSAKVQLSQTITRDMAI